MNSGQFEDETWAREQSPTPPYAQRPPASRKYQYTLIYDPRCSPPPPPQPYIGSPIAEEDADTELASYAAFSSDIDLLVDPANEVLYVVPPVSRLLSLLNQHFGSAQN